jgi:tetratricopeptide (TPR) repeat protein
LYFYLAHATISLYLYTNIQEAIMNSVRASVEKRAIPTYEPSAYEELPMFAFNRNHQGTSGNPYPNRIVNKVRRDKKGDVLYTAISLENDYISLTILPELGGRIFEAVDKSNGADFFYRQHSIKPALIGMYGLWISGGVEFNWPMHHRPGTFVPTDYYVESGESGAVTVWLSEHDPVSRMKGMVGITLYPDRAVVETRGRVFNRTSLPHSFLWWENAAVPANENVQIFFPPDVTYVTHHYKKATGAYPLMDSFYMGLDNRGGVDVRFHKNSRQGTSYFSGLSRFDFFGGYDHGKKTGLLHHASHYTSPGKKMFTWGYTNLSKDWERALTDTDGPYLELMASSYSDNQPDFTWIEPYETKEFVQTWYPYKELGEVQAANDRAALTCRREGGRLSLGLYATENLPRGCVEVSAPGKAPLRRDLYLKATDVRWEEFPLAGEDLTVKLLNEEGETVLAYTAEKAESLVPAPLAPYPGPGSLNDADDCCITGIHVDQYHDPLVEADVYWRRGLEINPRHPGCLTNLGRYLIGQLRFEEAESCLRKAVESLTRYNQNPRDTEAFYLLGLVLARQGKNSEALEILHKAMWNERALMPALCAAAAALSAQGKYAEAIKEIAAAMELHGKNQRAVGILITLLRKTGRRGAALNVAKDLLSTDPLDLHAINEMRLLGEGEYAERARYRLNETGIDLAADYAALGLWEDALDTLEWALGKAGPASMVLYGAGLAASMMGKKAVAEAYFAQAEKAPDSLRFPSLAFEEQALREAVRTRPGDGRANLELGMLVYGIRRDVDEAAAVWKKALAAETGSPAAGSSAAGSSAAMRNLAVALFHRNNRDGEALALMEKAAAARPGDLQLYYELNLVAELQNLPLAKRLAHWEGQRDYAEKWDELFLQGVRIHNQIGEWDKALAMLKTHEFTAAEGGEASIAAEYYYAHHALAYAAMEAGKYEKALEHFDHIFHSPYGIWNDIILCPYKYGQALCLDKMGKKKEAAEALTWITNLPLESQSFLPAFPYYLGMALTGLGKAEEGKEQFRQLKKVAEEALAVKPYGFFTATPSYESFIRDSGDLKAIQYNTLLALALSGLGEKEKAKAAVDAALALGPLNQQALMLKKSLEQA